MSVDVITLVVFDKIMHPFHRWTMSDRCGSGPETGLLRCEPDVSEQLMVSPLVPQ